MSRGEVATADVLAAIALRGWAVVPAGSVAAALTGWRPRESMTPPPESWWAAQPISADDPVGAVRGLVTADATAPLEIIPGSQGVPPADVDSAGVLAVGDQPGRCLVLDARCLLRLAAPQRVRRWEAW
jgi:hypothetical protein